jgi:hypothetical protein
MYVFLNFQLFYYVTMSFSPNILWSTDPLLGKDLETNNDTRAVAMQRRGKHGSTTVNGAFHVV